MKKIFKLGLEILITIFLLTVIAFTISRLAPGDPLRAYYGESVERLNNIEKESLRDDLGLNEPLYIQYTKWAKEALKGNFGISFKYKEDVTKVVGKVLKNTIILGGIGYLLTFLLAICIGIISAIYEDKLLDRLICFLGNISNSIPSFWVALVLILIFSVNLKVLPSGGAYTIGHQEDVLNRIKHLILPLIVLVISHLWYYAYIIRNKIIDEFGEDYVLLCKAKGESTGYIVIKHCLRNIMPSIISLMAISVPHIIGATYVVEKIFSYPGLGSLSIESAKYHDYNMILFICLITGIVVVVCGVVGNFISIKIDKRIGYRGN